MCANAQRSHKKHSRTAKPALHSPGTTGVGLNMRRFFLVRLVCVLGTLLLTSTYAAAQARRALVIGIDEYKNVEQLKRATADARAVAGQLKDIGFDVQLSVNAGRNQIHVAAAPASQGASQPTA